MIACICDITSFQSTLPVGGATRHSPPTLPAPGDFNPRSPWGERPSLVILRITRLLFQSTLPVGGATCPGRCLPPAANFNPRSPWGERHIKQYKYDWVWNISIHAPRGGSDLISNKIKTDTTVFQSTLPVGGATCG